MDFAFAESISIPTARNEQDTQHQSPLSPPGHGELM